MREKLLIICVFLIANIMPIYAYVEVPVYGDNTGDYNYYSNSQNNTQNYNSSDTYPKVTRIESLLFKRSFVDEDIENRLARIETKIFRRINNNMSLSERVDLISNNIDPGLFYDISPEQVAIVENKIFGRAYPNDDTETRIIRLEKEMLGAMQDGNLKERFDVVAQAAKHYTSFSSLQQDNNYSTQQPYYQNNYQQQYYNNAPYSSYSTQGGFKNTLGNILSGFFGGGTMTGFTPSIFPGQYNNGYQYYPNNPYYNNPYSSQGVQDNRYIQTRHGYYNSDKSYGTGSGVKVLYD